MKPDRIVLASGSPRRKQLLEQVGMKFDIIVSDVEEIVTKTLPKDVVCELSAQKAQAVYDRLEDTNNVLVIGADTVVSAENRILGKPHDRDDAFRMLKLIQGESHSVFTGVTLIHNDTAETFAVETKVHVMPMTDEQIYAYIDTKEPIDKAGAYGIQGRFAAYVSGIDGDYNNVVGLPVAAICDKLRSDGYEI